MSSLPQVPGRWFGSGGDEPYAAAFGASPVALRLTRVGRGTPARPLDFPRWTAAADAADRRVLAGLRGPLLDVGCGPGRMVRAALDADLAALGIDVDRGAIEHCTAEGLPVLHRSVFGRLPREGAWGAVLLLDGNIGIGGDPAALLGRSASLLRPGGTVVVEADRDPGREETFLGRVTDGEGRRSAVFPWSELGATAIDRLAGVAGLGLRTAWIDGDRSFRCYRVR